MVVVVVRVNKNHFKCKFHFTNSISESDKTHDGVTILTIHFILTCHSYYNYNSTILKSLQTNRKPLPGRINAIKCLRLRPCPPQPHLRCLLLWRNRHQCRHAPCPGWTRPSGAAIQWPARGASPRTWWSGAVALPPRSWSGAIQAKISLVWRAINGPERLRMPAKVELTEWE